MLKGNKILYLIFFVLLVVTIGEVAYYFFFNQPMKKQVSSPEINVSSPERIEPTTVNISQAPNTQPQTQRESAKVNLISMLIDKRAQLKDGALILDNTGGDNYLGYTSQPIKINSSFRILVNLEVEGNTDSQLTLSGKLKKLGGQWWEGIQTLFIIRTNNSLRMELRDGRSPTSVLSLPFSELLSTDTFTLEFFDSQGKSFAVLDKEGKILDKVVLSELKELEFPTGLFPDSQMWAGINVGPKSKATVNQFLFISSPQ